MLLETYLAIFTIVCSTLSFVFSILATRYSRKVMRAIEDKNQQDAFEKEERLYHIKNPRKKDKKGKYLMINDIVFYQKKRWVVVFGTEFTLYRSGTEISITNIPSKELLIISR